MTLHDVSVPLREGMPIWPGSTGYSRRLALGIARGDGVNASVITMDVHTGTHIDAPLHFVEDGSDTEGISLDTLIGPATVADVGDAESITGDYLANLGIPHDCTRLILKTRNSTYWQSDSESFRDDFVALTGDAAVWVVDRGIKLIGVDYLSVQRYSDGPEVHLHLLRNDVVIVEGLNLIDVLPGPYELNCLPLRLQGSEGAPARVILRSL